MTTMTGPRSHIAHAWAVVVIGYWTILAGALIVGPWVGWSPVLSLAGVDAWLTIAIGVLIATGSVLIIMSLLRHRYRSTRWTLELMGLILAGGGWFALGWASSVAFPAGLSGWPQAAAFTAACVLRGREVIIVERRTRAAVEHLEGD